MGTEAPKGTYISTAAQINSYVCYRTLGVHSLLAPAASMSVTLPTLPSTPLTLRVIAMWGIPSAGGTEVIRFNGDSGNNYFWMFDENNNVPLQGGPDSKISFFASGHTDKGMVEFTTTTDPAATGSNSLVGQAVVCPLPNVQKSEFVGHYNNGPITSVQLVRSAGNFPIGSTMIVLGW